MRDVNKIMSLIVPDAIALTGTVPIIRRIGDNTPVTKGVTAMEHRAIYHEVIAQGTEKGGT
jgi:hypothetical protein